MDYNYNKWSSIQNLVQQQQQKQQPLFEKIAKVKRCQSAKNMRILDTQGVKKKSDFLEDYRKFSQQNKQKQVFQLDLTMLKQPLNSNEITFRNERLFRDQDNNSPPPIRRDTGKQNKISLSEFKKVFFVKPGSVQQTRQITRTIKEKEFENKLSQIQNSYNGQNVQLQTTQNKQGSMKKYFPSIQQQQPQPKK